MAAKLPDRSRVNANSCLPDDTVLAFVQGALDGDAAATVEGHIGYCQCCRRVLADAAQFFLEPEQPPPDANADADPAPAPAPLLLPGATVGRYKILDLVGLGGAGMVYRAHDPELARQVALKIVQLERSVMSRDALIGEAQAMARLSHPNVVTVFDAGTFAGGVFLIMELVEGPTLSQWLAEQRRPVPDVLSALIEAGRGLAAAHAAGLAHGDFKAQNVLVGSGGRTRVTDFGLATVVRWLPRPGLQPTAARVSGTPQFMAPEQFLGRQADPWTDQFGFCVTCWTALYGEHPFAAPDHSGDLRLLVAAVLAGKLRPPPGLTDVPPRVMTVLARGLSRSPERRFPSMDALLDELVATLPPMRGYPPAGPRVGQRDRCGTRRRRAERRHRAWATARRDGGILADPSTRRGGHLARGSARAGG